MFGLSPYAPTTFEIASAYLQRKEGARPDDVDRIVRAVNDAVAWMERRTNRALVARTYRTPVVIACTGADAASTLTGTGFTTNVKTLDDVVGAAGLGLGSRVLSIESAVGLTLTEKLTANVAANLSFGSEPLRQSGGGEAALYLVERPLVELYSVTSLAGDDDEEIDVTDARIEKSVGLVQLADGAFPLGDLNLLIECKAGYVQPSSTVRGDWSDWGALQHICHRAAQVFFKDEVDSPGRLTSKQVLQAGGNMPGFEMPEDIEQAIRPFVRQW